MVECEIERPIERLSSAYPWGPGEELGSDSGWSYTKFLLLLSAVNALCSSGVGSANGRYLDSSIKITLMKVDTVPVSRTEPYYGTANMQSSQTPFGLTLRCVQSSYDSITCGFCSLSGPFFPGL